MDSATLIMGSGDDVAHTNYLGINASVDGGAGVDRLTFDYDTTRLAHDPIVMTLAGDTVTLASGFIFSHFEAMSITGSRSDDRLVSLNSPTGVAGDSFDGGQGRDTVSYEGSLAGVTVSLATAAAQDTGGGGTDTLRRIENLVGSGFDDRVTGNAASNVIDGGAGNDRLDTRDGSDRLSGGAGDDVLLGGAGNDRLTGGAGADVMTGGADKDLFVFASMDDFARGATLDRITDYVRGTDKIDLSAIDPDAGLAGDQSFTFIAGRAFAGNAATYEVRYEAASGGNLLVQLDVNHDGTADASFLVHAPLLGGGDFLL